MTIIPCYNVMKLHDQVFFFTAVLKSSKMGSILLQPDLFLLAVP